ncbi:MAG: molybdate ABC transporter substrate-binding protein [Thermodesulfobacteriota bacterium]
MAIMLLLALLLVPLPALSAEVRLSAAASMNDAVKELVRSFTKENPDITILPNFASSGSLAKQILQGAPADIYISANQKWLDYLVPKKAIKPQTVHDFAYNALVFVGRDQTRIKTMKDVASLSHIAIGSPRSVPAGQYAAQAMTKAGIYQQMVREHKLVMAKDVSQALIYAERGEVDGAFVYRSDALLGRHATILFNVPAELHERIVYPMGLTLHGAKNNAAQAFFSFLKSHEASKILTNYGFETASVPDPDLQQR